MFKCETMPNGGRSANQHKGMILDLVYWSLCANICLSARIRERNKSWLCTANCCSVWVHRTVRCARLALVKRLLSGIRRRRTTIIHRIVRWCTIPSGEPTDGRANGRPRNPRVTRGRANGLMGHRTVRCAPDCPVRHPTEGKNCLPGLLSTAPSCLGAIKGTPRRMEEDTKHTLSILDHSHSVFAHSIGILSDLSSVLVVNLVLFI
jgi:hypothetical protein